MSVGVLYLGNFKKGEEALLSGIDTQRIEQLSDLGRSTDLGKDFWILRSSKLSVEEYCRTREALRESGMDMVTSPLSFTMVSSLRAAGNVMAPFAPPMIAARRDESAEKLAVAATKAGLNPPLFVRSEIESAAKYVGVEGCVARDLDPNAIQATLSALEAHVSEFSEVAVKEVWSIKRLGRTEFDLEYRTIGFRGNLVEVDYSRGNLLPPLGPAQLNFLNHAFGALAEAGMDGSVVLDLAIRESTGAPFVVEWKDLSSSSLKNPLRCLGSLVKAIEREYMHKV